MKAAIAQTPVTIASKACEAPNPIYLVSFLVREDFAEFILNTFTKHRVAVNELEIRL